jgi:DNA-binding transcriptional regulator YiaG
MTEQTTDVATVTEPVEPSTTTESDPTLSEIKAMADELGITPGQLKGRLEASRKWEQRAKDNSKAAERLAEIEAANLSETEKAVKEAEQRGASAARADFGQRLAAAEIKAALTGVVPDPAAIVEDLNLGKYVTDTGDVDQEAVTALRSKYESFASKKPPVPDLHQGNKGSARNDLDQQIAEATAAGNHALAISLKRQKAYAAPTT